MNNEIVFAFPMGCLGLGLYEFALVQSAMVFCVPPETPPALLRRPQLCIKQLYAVGDGYTC